MIRTVAATLGAAIALAAPQVFASPTVGAPPAGNVIYQLTGKTAYAGASHGTAIFTADSTTTNLTFALRGLVSFFDVSLADQTNPSINLLTNGGFSNQTHDVGGWSEPDGWTYVTFGATGGHIGSGACSSPLYCYTGNAAGAYDGINQAVTTVVGDKYNVSFEYYDGYSPTDGDIYAADSMDMFVYAGDSIPTAAPEPAALALLASGILGMTFFRRRSR